MSEAIGLKFLIVPVLISAFYCLMVCVCVTGRMSGDTKAMVRWPIVVLGAVSAWAILKTLEGGWQPNLPTFVHATVLVGGALFLALRPRIQT